MAISVPFPPPPTGGPISGELVDTFLDNTRWQVLVWRQPTAGTWQFITQVPVAPVWSSGLVQAGVKYAAAVVSTTVLTPPASPPPLSATVANLAIFDPNRVSLNVGTGAVNGKVSGLGAPTSFRVRLYGAAYDTGWGFVGDSAVDGQGNWSVSTTATPLQWAAVLVGPGWQVNAGQAAAGLLPVDGTNTAFGGSVQLRVQGWPGPSGGPIKGVLVGLARSTGLVAYALSVQADGKIAAAATALDPNGTWSFADVRRGTRYAVVISDTLNQVFLAVPSSVGGRIITYATSS